AIRAFQRADDFCKIIRAELAESPLIVLPRPLQGFECVAMQRHLVYLGFERLQSLEIARNLPCVVLRQSSWSAEFTLEFALIFFVGHRPTFHRSRSGIASIAFRFALPLTH